MPKFENDSVFTPSGKQEFVKLFPPIANQHGPAVAAVFGAIYGYCAMSKSGQCFASYAKIGARIGLDYRTVRRHTKTLVESGWIIECEHQKGGGTNVFECNEFMLNRAFLGLEEPKRADKLTQDPGQIDLPLPQRAVKLTQDPGQVDPLRESLREDLRLIEEEDDDDNSSSSALPNLKSAIAKITGLNESNPKVLEAAEHLEAEDVPVDSIEEWFEMKWPSERVSNAKHPAPWPVQVADGVTSYESKRFKPNGPENPTPRGSRPG